MIQLARTYRQKSPVIRVRLHRVRRDGKAGQSYEVDLGRIEGRRKRISFQTRKEAATFAKQHQMTLALEGKQGVLMSEDLRVDAKRSQRLLEEAGHHVSIERCVEFYLNKNSTPQELKTVENVIQELRDELVRGNRSAGHIKLTTGLLQTLFSPLLSQDIRSIRREDIQRLIDELSTSRKLSIDSVRSYYTYSKLLFNFSIQRGYSTENPMVTMKKPEKAEELPDQILSLKQVQEILRVAHEDPIHRALLPVVAIQLFAGLRSSEALKLDWSEVKWDSGHIHVLGKKSKSRKNRYVTIQPVLLQWLKPYRQESGKVAPTGYHERIKSLRKAAGVTKWPRNAFRHTFASNHAGHFKDTMSNDN